MTECAYCGQRVEDHDPVRVAEGSDDATEDDYTLVGHFCNYACLIAHVEEHELTTGACCAWTPA